MIKSKPPRERAARALCRMDDLPENTKFEGLAYVGKFSASGGRGAGSRFIAGRIGEDEGVVLACIHTGSETSWSF